jgi:tetratricopeptide (TPR) repeat protein
VSARLEMLEKLIGKGSSDPFVHYARAMELRALGRGPAALAAFAAVRESFPSYVPTYLMAGQLAVELAEPEQAQQFLTQGLAVAREAGDSHAESELRSALAGLSA